MFYCFFVTPYLWYSGIKFQTFSYYYFEVDNHVSVKSDKFSCNTFKFNIFIERP